MIPRVQRICGTHRYSPLQLSEAVSALNLTHLVYRAHSSTKTVLRRRIGEGEASVLIADGLNSIRRKRRGLVIVTAPKAELALTNIPQLESDDLVADIRAHLKRAPVELDIHVASVMDFVNVAVRPSILTDIQTTLYRISNTQLRKAAQVALVRTLDSKHSVTKLIRDLSANLYTAPLSELARHPDFEALRAAVLRFRQGEDSLSIELSTKFTSFDILYVARSSDLINKAAP